MTVVGGVFFLFDPETEIHKYVRCRVVVGGLLHLKAPSTTNLALTAQIHYEIPFGPPCARASLPPFPNLTFLARLGYFCGSLERPRATAALCED